LAQICTKSSVGWGFAPDPLGSLERSPGTIVAFKGPTSKGSKVEERKGKVGEGGPDRKKERKGMSDGKRGKGEKGSSARPLFRCFRRLCL